GNRKHARRNCKAERFRGFEVDHKLELRRLHDRQVGGLLALENARRVDTRLAVSVWLAGAIAHQATRQYVLAQRIDRYQSLTGSERHDLSVLATGEKTSAAHQQRARARAGNRREGGLEVRCGASLYH